MTILLYFLYKNNRWLKVDEIKFYNFANWVASSDAELKDETISAVEKFLDMYTIDVK